MKKLAFIVLITAASTAAYSWVCTAQSPTAVGQWISPYLNIAQERALYECGVRTPYFQTCVITSCY